MPGSEQATIEDDALTREELAAELKRLRARVGEIEAASKEMQRTEEALRRNVQAFAESQRLSKIGHWIYSFESENYITISDECARIYGITMERILEDNRGETERALHPDDHDRVAKTWAWTVEEAHDYELEYRILRPDGEIRHAVEIVEIIRDASGRAVEEWGTIQDITERKKTEEALVEGEQRFKDFAASASQWFWEADPDLRFTFVSEGYEKATGVSPSFAYGQRREDIGGADLTEKHWADHLADLAAHRPFADFEYTQNLSDGRIAHFSVSGIPRFSRDGTFLGYRGTGREITERKQAEEALRLNAQALAEAQRQAKIGHWIWSFERNGYITISDEFVRIFGTSSKRLMQGDRENMEGAIHPDDRDHVTETWVFKAEDAHYYEMKYRVIRPDGKVRHILEIGEPIRNASGRVVEERGTVQDVTEHKRVEEALRVNALALAEAQRLAKIGHWTWSFESNDFITLSDEFVRIYGIPKARILADNEGELVRILHPDDRDDVVKSWIWKAGEARVFQTEYRIIRPDGEMRHVVEIGEPIRDASGRVVGERGTVQDVTERKRAEAALRESEERYRRLVEVSPEGIFVNSQGKFVLANPAAVRMLGARSLEDLLGREVFDVLHPDFLEAVRPRARAVLETGENAGWMDQVYVGIDGRHFPVESSATAIQYQGHPAILSMFRDITERKEAEEALKQSEAETARAREQLVEAIETISEGFAWFDTEDRLFLFNNRYRELYGDSAEFIVPGTRFEDIIRKGAESGQYAEAVGRVEAWVRERVEQHQNPKGPFYQQLGDGRWLQIEERKLPGGGIVGVRTEITRLKEMEDELVRKERLATLGQLTGTVSHELRNPLGAIRTSIAAIKKLTAAVELPRLDDTVDIADRSITRCDKIIADLLDFTRAPQLQSQATAIDPWLEEELDELPLAPEIMLRRELSSGAMIAFDRDRLGRALRNLTDNAVQAMAGQPDGADKILTVRSAVADGRLEISVSDTGCGIALLDLPKVFQPLFSTKSFGVGLGMPMVQQILEQHGGGIDITSEPGKGTGVVLWLPIESGQPAGGP